MASITGSPVAIVTAQLQTQDHTLSAGEAIKRAVEIVDALTVAGLVPSQANSDLAARAHRQIVRDRAATAEAEAVLDRVMPHRIRPRRTHAR